MRGPNPMRIGPGLVTVRAMGSAMVQGIGVVRSDTMGFLMELTDHWGLDGMADMEDSVRHVHRLVRRHRVRLYPPIRHRGSEKTTEQLIQFTLM